MKCNELWCIPSIEFLKKRFEIPLEGIIQRAMYFILGFSIALLIVFFLRGDNANILSTIKTAASVLIGLSIIMTAAQFIYNRRWNQKDAAIKAMHQSSGRTTELNQKIDKYLNTTYSVQHNIAIPIYEIHNKMGVFLNNGDFVYHGEETQDDIKNIHNNERAVNYTREFNERIKGRDIENLLKKILNEYEYIATACIKGIFDKDVVISLKGTGIIKTFNVFSNYIYHLRYDARHDNGNRMYKNFEDFAHEVYSRLSKISGNGHIPTVLKPEEDQYKTPFDEREAN